MAVLNPSFESAGATSGQAASWSVVTTATVEELAEFGATPEPWETFEAGWGNEPHVTELGLADIDPAEYDDGTVNPAVHEGFDTAWGNEPHITELSLLEDALYNGATEETFESGAGWDADYKTEFSGGDLSSATFSGNAFETFAATDGWDATYKDAFVGVGTDLELAAYNWLNSGTPATETRESFERNRNLPQLFTVDTGTDLVTTPEPHGMGANDRVMFVAGTGELPAPFNEVTIYTVSSVASTLLGLSDDSGPVDITDTGTGVGHTVLGDPTYYWNTEE